MAEAWGRTLSAGQRICVSYGHEQHEVFLLAPAERKEGTTKWVVANADWNIYVNDLTVSKGAVRLGPGGNLTMDLLKEEHQGVTFFRFDNGELKPRMADLMKKGLEVAIELGAVDRPETPVEAGDDEDKEARHPKVEEDDSDDDCWGTWSAKDLPKTKWEIDEKEPDEVPVVKEEDITTLTTLAAFWRRGPPPGGNLVALEARFGLTVGEPVPKRGKGGLTLYPTDVISHLFVEDRVLLRFPDGILAAGVDGTVDLEKAEDPAEIVADHSHTEHYDGAGNYIGKTAEPTLLDVLSSTTGTATADFKASQNKDDKGSQGREKRPRCKTCGGPQSFVKPEPEEPVASDAADAVEPPAFDSKIRGSVAQAMDERRRARDKGGPARSTGAAASQLKTEPGGTTGRGGGRR